MTVSPSGNLLVITKSRKSRHSASETGAMSRRAVPKYNSVRRKVSRIEGAARGVFALCAFTEGGQIQIASTSAAITRFEIELCVNLLLFAGLPRYVALA